MKSPNKNQQNFNRPLELASMMKTNFYIGFYTSIGHTQFPNGFFFYFYFIIFTFTHM
jgi:hypothetical protein